MRHIPDQWIMGTGLVGQGIGNNIPLDQPVEQVDGIAKDTDAFGFAFTTVMDGRINGIVNIGMLLVEVAGFEPLINPPLFHFSYQGHAFVHGNGQGLGAAHSTKTSGNIQGAFEGTTKMFIGCGSIGLVGTLYNALRTDIDPGTGRHLSVHHQAFLFQFGKMFPVGPVGYQLRIADQYPGRVFMGFEYTHRFARLYQ